ncbi:ribonuclease H-like domain-containing protein [Flagelloscypha sp. PMI_526]|nr:ribonuclease H-like domain-containing protein [Flagelloscypha sp. PMI_526]
MYRPAIQRYTLVQPELGPSQSLTSQDWDALQKVSDWLGSFRAATTQMSSTKKPMLCHTHKVFRSLQKDLRKMIVELPENDDSSTVRLREGLVAAHKKLSDYYFKFDQTPYYHWAVLLDPRVSYTRLKREYASDHQLSEDLEVALADLTVEYKTYYAPSPGHSRRLPKVASDSAASPSKRDYLLDSDDEDEVEPELDEELTRYFRLTEKPEPMKTTDVLEWWYMRRHQLPHLYCLARDIHGIPGEFLCCKSDTKLIFIIQDLQLPSREFSQAVETQLAFVEQALSPKQFELSCW